MYGDGLGQTDNEVISARDILLRQITRLDAELSQFSDGVIARKAREELRKAKGWYRAALERFYASANNPDAMGSIVAGMEHANAASKLIQQLEPRHEVYKQAEAETARGASVTYQLSRTMEVISEPIAEALETISAPVAAAVRSNWWLIPLVGGGVAFFLLRR